MHDKHPHKDHDDTEAPVVQPMAEPENLPLPGDDSGGGGTKNPPPPAPGPND